MLNEFGDIICFGEHHKFSGLETYEQIKQYAYEVFPDAHLCGIKVGKKGGPALQSFGGTSLRTYLRQQKLSPSKSNIYVMQDTKIGPKPAKQPRPEERESTFDEEIGDGDPPAAGDNIQEGILPVQCVPESDIVVEDLIEEGGCNPVYKGKWRANDVALKKFVLKKRQDAAMFKQAVSNEVSVHASIRHPNIVQLYAMCEAEDGKVFYLVTELMETSLEKMIYSQEPLKLQNQIEIAVKITQGVEYLHEKSIVHGDVKPSNVLASLDASSVKVCDFGMSRIKKSPGVTMCERPAGTVMFMTPEELLSGVKANFRSDSWALGATLAELFTGQQFWQIPKKKDAQTFIKKEMQDQHMPNAMIALRKKNKKLFSVLEGSLSYVPEMRDRVSVLRGKLEAYMREKN